jgi:hypothetical protein
MHSRGKIDSPITHSHERSISWLGTGFLVKSDGVKLVFQINNVKLHKLKII